MPQLVAAGAKAQKATCDAFSCMADLKVSSSNCFIASSYDHSVNHHHSLTACVWLALAGCAADLPALTPPLPLLAACAAPTAAADGMTYR